MGEYKNFEKQRIVKQLFFSGLFILVLVGGWFFPLLGFFIPLCMVLGVSIAFFQGRKWCDWYCPRGSFWDYMIKPLSPHKAIPAFFKNMFVRLSILAFLMGLMAWQIISRWPDPYKIGKFFAMMLTITTAAGIVLALIYHQRLWCYVCPIGTLSNLAGKDKKPLKIKSHLCVECKQCFKVCPMQIKAYSYKKDESVIDVKDGDCLKCESCVYACPRKALYF
ncbi:MAG: 4Fe-4S binding protein [Candidatus Omnitrophota bacterium]